MRPFLPGAETLVISSIMLSALCTQPLRAQLLVRSPDKPLPSFEVASIKPSLPGNSHSGLGVSGDRLSVENMPLKRIIEFAFNAKSDAQVIGGPDWVKSKTYDINAKEDESQVAELKKLPPEQRQSQVRLMLQSLLIDRFKLQVSRQEKELPIYALVVTKNGAKLSPAAPPAAVEGIQAQPSQRRHGISTTNGKMTATGISMAFFADNLTRQREAGGRLVVDKTGLSGEYDFSLNWTPESFLDSSNEIESPGSRGSADTNGTSLFTALKEQLGLKLEPQKGAVEILVIDHVEPPSAN